MLKKGVKLVLKVLLSFFLLTLAWVVLYRFVNPPITTMMIYKYMHNDKQDVSRTWVDIEDVSPRVPLAFIASEDQLFLSHHGFDLHAIKKALSKNAKGKRKIGASTISQQVAKNVFLIPNKTYFRKGLEAYFTVLIEWIWGKRRIMEVYLNSVEMGDGIYGVEAAAQGYFKKPAEGLTLSESALMAVALPNPLLFPLERPNAYMYKRSEWVKRQMWNLGGVDILEDWYK